MFFNIQLFKLLICFRTPTSKCYLKLNVATDNFLFTYVTMANLCLKIATLVTSVIWGRFEKGTFIRV